MNSSARRLALSVGWLACAVLLALGAAGLVAGASHEPGTAARAELTWAADEAVRPGLADASADLARLSTEVEELGRYGRLALAALVARNLDGLDEAIAQGSARVAAIDAISAALSSRLAGLPGVGPGMAGRLGADVRARYEAIGSALVVTAGLRESWATLTAGSAAASHLATLLADHDTAAGEAARLGSGRSYAAALEQLTSATAALDAARALRDALANTVDVSILDQWLTRNRDLDEALGALYDALLTSRGVVTREVRAAAAAEQAAQQRLPPDTRGLVVIFADIARGGLNQAVIGIEQAKGKLAAAVDELARIDADEAGSGGSATPAP